MRMRCLLALAPVVMMGADAPKDDAAKKELEKFQGTWQLVSAETDGKTAPDEQVKKTRVVVQGSKHSVYFGDQAVVHEIPFTIDPMTNPKSVEDKVPDGRIIRSIYVLDGDTLRTCAAEPGKDRPKEFTAKAGSGQTLRVFKRLKPSTAGAEKAAWKPLFDGKSLADWKAADYGEGSGKVNVQDGAIVMELGAPMTGVSYTRGGFPKLEYEVAFEGKRVEGGDFFCTTTFPVGDTFCSLVVGGWGGNVIGLSSVNHEDASENETTSSKDFESNKWYRIRIRVTQSRIAAWIDDEQVVDLETTDRKISIRRECEVCKPFGFATWKTAGAVRGIQVRSLTDAEVKAGGKKGGGSEQ